MIAVPTVPLWLPGFVTTGATFAAAIVQLNVALPVPPRPSFAVTVTLEVPAAVGVPVIRPLVLIASPAGNPVALNVSGSLLPSLATICSPVIAVPTVPLCAPGFVTTGATFAACVLPVTGPAAADSLPAAS